jgi:hypothetical protein
MNSKITMSCHASEGSCLCAKYHNLPRISLKATLSKIGFFFLLWSAAGPGSLRSPVKDLVSSRFENDNVLCHSRILEYQKSGVTANKPPLGVDNIAGEID